MNRQLGILSVMGLGFAAVSAIQILPAWQSANAWAAEARAAPEDFRAQTSEATDSTQISDMSQDDTQECFTEELAQRLWDDSARADLRLDAIIKREAEVKALSEEVEARIKNLSQAQADLKAMTAKLDATAETDITHLVSMYSTMKPGKAAEIFDKMDPAFAAGFLREMDSNRAGLIMAEMRADHSYRISVLIASRGASWRGKASEQKG